MGGLVIFLAVLLVIAVISGLRVVDQYERGVVLRFGKLDSIKDAGLRFILPYGIDRMIKVDRRIATVDVPRQEVITRDNVTIGVDAVVYFNVKDVQKAVLEIQNFRQATMLYAQAVMRDVVGEVELDTLLSERDKLSEEIKKLVDVETDKWGINVDAIKIQNIELAQDMKRAMARQAETERERRAVIISAQGEKESATALAEAARILATAPGAMNIRTLETIEKIAPESSQKTMFVLPADLFESIKHFVPSAKDSTPK